MQPKLLRNIDIVQINITAGQEEYYFPKNVDWNDRVVDRIAIAAPSVNITSPIDGTTHVLKRSEIKNLYFDLYSKDDKDLSRELSFEQLLHTNNYPYLVNDKINLDLSRLYFTEAPTTSGCILLYIYYNGVDRPEEEQSRKSLTIRFPMAANEKMTFTDLVNTYMYASPIENEIYEKILDSDDENLGGLYNNMALALMDLKRYIVELIKQQILIRDCSDYENLKNGFYRVAVKSHDENKILLRKIKKALE